MWWKARGSHSLGMPASRSRSPMRRPRRSRPALRAAEKMRRQRLASLIVFVEIKINCFVAVIHSIARVSACSFQSPRPTQAS